MSALSREILTHKGNPPATHWTPAQSRVCRLRRLRKPTPYVAPIGGQMPPRQPCQPDRDAFGPASRPSCLTLMKAFRKEGNRGTMPLTETASPSN